MPSAESPETADVKVNAELSGGAGYGTRSVPATKPTVYVNNVIRGKLLESKVLIQQALNNSKEQSTSEVKHGCVWKRITRQDWIFDEVPRIGVFFGRGRSTRCERTP